ncbi:MAG: AbrB/MazE/SpoVT family DNA-binding domain-containing protein [Candidatus Micrarchaeota archaeon]|nr:AbrB/MazE/SpoVT family DNA-binding domain-containing protein [Candidatus Micrarchaeota archaeon]
MDYEGKVTRQGQITLPQKIRRRYSIKEGDIVTYVDLGDHIVVLPRTKSALQTLLSLKIKTKESVQKIKQKIRYAATEEANKRGV